MGDRKRASRKRAEGTREHIVAYLVQSGELADPGGMASTRLAVAVGYPGSSVAFAQLLSGMERSGIIEREVRGKRTYRIGLSRAHMATAASPGAEALAGFDYDELARRLLAQVVRRLAGSGPADSADLRETVTGLESELASAWTKHGQLTEENVRLRERLQAAEASLALARESLRKRSGPAELDSADLVLLQRLLGPEAGTGYSAATPG